MIKIDYEKFMKAPADAFVDFCNKANVPPSPPEKIFFFAGWYAASAYAEEQHQHVDNFDKFGNPEQHSTSPDREMMRFEAAKAALTGILSNSNSFGGRNPACHDSESCKMRSAQDLADMAVACADRPFSDLTMDKTVLNKPTKQIRTNNYNTE